MVVACVTGRSGQRSQGRADQTCQWPGVLRERGVTDDTWGFGWCYWHEALVVYPKEGRFSRSRQQGRVEINGFLDMLVKFVM